MARSQVALINMPFGSVENPSIQLGLLAAHCEHGGIPVDQFYFNLDFYRIIGRKIYNAISYIRGPLVGEWLFSEDVFGNFQNESEFIEENQQYISEMQEYGEFTTSQLLNIRKNLVPEFCSQIIDQIASYDIVGFSATFQQTMPCLAIARRLKKANPNVKLLLGGANFEGRMGLEHTKHLGNELGIFFSGEADDIIVPLISALQMGVRAPVVEGVLDTLMADAPRATYRKHMDDLPIPNYAPYFQRLVALELSPHEFEFGLTLPIETSRGCWWGQKHHCTFCGLNAGGMTYRAKSPARVAREIRNLVDTYNVTKFTAVDNIIPSKNLDELCTELEKIPGISIFYEIKANVTTRITDMLSRAGIASVQPGIENFSDHILKLMEKGISGLQNVNALRSLVTSGITPYWNFLYGFPGEKIEDYLSQVELVRRIVHLPAPLSITRIRIDRFSPYFEKDHLREQFYRVEPQKSYRYMYPEEFDLSEVAYFFDGECADTVSDSQLEPLLSQLHCWQALWKAHAGGEALPFLTHSQEGPSEVTVLDGRHSPAEPERYLLTGLTAALYLDLCDGPVGLEKLREGVRRNYSDAASDRVGQALQGLDDLGIIAIVDKTALALGLPIRSLRPDISKAPLFHTSAIES